MINNTSKRIRTIIIYTVLQNIRLRHKTYMLKVISMIGFGKGKIEIQLNNYNYKPGDMVEGKVALKLKKPLEGKQLTIRILGQKRVKHTSVSSSGPSQTYRTETVFDFKQPLDGEKTYGTGLLEYPFKIQIPDDVKPKIPEGTLGTVFKAAQMFSGLEARTTWYLFARLDVKGFDLTKKIQINVT